jgi:hypothetical protein
VKHRAEALISANHYDPQSVREIAEEVTKRWQQLVTCAEERHKLVTASINFYKTAEQVSDFHTRIAADLAKIKTDSTGIFPVPYCCSMPNLTSICKCLQHTDS